jgi:phage recombination protein Bet
VGQDLAVVPARQHSIAERMRGEFDPGQVELIRNTVAKDASPAELGMFLELCKRYELDPFAGQIYCAKMRNENGEGGRVQIIVGRDGFLSIANRHPDFEGFDSDVVREKDTFKMRRGEGNAPIVTHEYEGGAVQRGKIIGAWAIVYRAGRRPRYFFAHLHEYQPKNERKLKFSPWGSQESVMIEKCAITTALRLAFNITGLIGEEEASRQLADENAPAPGEIEWADDDTQVGEYLRALFAAANEARPDSFLPKKQAMMLRGKSDDERWVLAQELAEFVRTNGGTVPPLPEVPEGGAQEDEDEPEDAEVVAESEPEIVGSTGDEGAQETLPVE